MQISLKQDIKMPK